MKWIHQDEWYCWCSIEGERKPELAKFYPSHYARVPDELAARFERAAEAFAAIQLEVEAYAGKER